MSAEACQYGIENPNLENCRHVATLNLRMTYGITGLSRDDKVSISSNHSSSQPPNEYP